VGGDAEWDALTTEDKRDPHPAPLQLSLADGSIVVVLHILHMFSRINESEISSCTLLAQIMCHPKILLSGVNLATDIGHLAKHYSHHFIGEKDTLLKRAYDVKKVLQGLGLVGGDYGMGSLDALLQRYENKTLDKVYNMPPTPTPTCQNNSVLISDVPVCKHHVSDACCIQMERKCFAESQNTVCCS
jgi:hypothetical protein